MTETIEDMGPLRTMTIGDLGGRECKHDESMQKTGRKEINRLKQKQRVGWQEEMGKSQLVGG